MLGAIAVTLVSAVLSCILCTHFVSEMVCSGKWVPGDKLITGPLPREPAYL